MVYTRGSDCALMKKSANINKGNKKKKGAQPGGWYYVGPHGGGMPFFPKGYEKKGKYWEDGD